MGQLSRRAFEPIAPFVSSLSSPPKLHRCDCLDLCFLVLFNTSLPPQQIRYAYTQVINEELGAPWYEVFAELTPEPIAAASLGQVRTVLRLRNAVVRLL